MTKILMLILKETIFLITYPTAVAVFRILQITCLLKFQETEIVEVFAGKVMMKHLLIIIMIKGKIIIS